MSGDPIAMANQNRGYGQIRSARLWGAVILLVGAAAVYGIYGFAESEHLRDLRHQQARMNIIANSRVDAVNRWIESQYAHLADLARTTRCSST